MVKNYSIYAFISSRFDVDYGQTAEGRAAEKKWMKLEFLRPQLTFGLIVVTTAEVTGDMT